MNLVAHQYLSFQNEEWQIGNLLGEVIRGKEYKKYSDGIIEGILLHRRIDSFTDQHPEVKKCTHIFHETQGKYAPIIIDILFDYFLINNWEDYTDTPFSQFKKECYQLFEKHIDTFPENLKIMTKNLIQYDWFEKYTSLEGIGDTLQQIGIRTPYANNLQNTMKEIYFHETTLYSHFQFFFNDLFEECTSFLKL